MLGVPVSLLVCRLKRRCPMELIVCSDELIERVIGAAIEVHRVLGPGLLESIYERALMVELADQGIAAPSGRGPRLVQGP